MTHGKGCVHEDNSRQNNWLRPRGRALHLQYIQCSSILRLADSAGTTAYVQISNLEYTKLQAENTNSPWNCSIWLFLHVSCTLITSF